jgi:hypothetical protein
MTRAHTETSSPMLAVYAGQRCLGHLLHRGRIGWEAFDHEDCSRGIFPSQREAADAISGAVS